MEKIPPHDYVADPRRGSALCASCKLPSTHPIHYRRTIQGSALPTVLK